VIVTSVLTAYWFTYHESLSRLSSILLGYLVLVPFFAAGQSASAGFANNSLPLLIIGLTRLTVAMLVMFLTTWVLGFPPRTPFGIFIAVLILSLATVSLIEIIHREQNPIQAQTPEPTMVVVPTSTPVPPTPTALPPTATATSIPTATTEPTPTLEPTATVPNYTSARVTAPNGLVIREDPSTSSPNLASVFLNEIVQLTGVQETNQGINWSQVIAPNGVIGWGSTQFLEVITP
jgi:outer membrane biosynthesis protein TonB